MKISLKCLGIRVASRTLLSVASGVLWIILAAPASAITIQEGGGGPSYNDAGAVFGYQDLGVLELGRTYLLGGGISVDSVTGEVDNIDGYGFTLAPGTAITSWECPLKFFNGYPAGKCNILVAPAGVEQDPFFSSMLGSFNQDAYYPGGTQQDPVPFSTMWNTPGDYEFLYTGIWGRLVYSSIDVVAIGVPGVPVPEPSALFLYGIGLLALGVTRRGYAG